MEESLRRGFCFPFEWLFETIHSIILTCACIFAPWLECFPCFSEHALYDGEQVWKWSRVWKSDEQREREYHMHRARCCANDRDEWRIWARQRDLIPPERKVGMMARWIGLAKQLFHSKPNRRRSEDRGEGVIIGRATSMNATFPFLGLPPELREQVYIYYMKGWSDTRIAHRSPRDPGIPLPPYEPPLTRASRLIRNESVPVFYRTARFPVISHPQPHKNLWHTTFDVVRWYDNLDPARIPLIRHLELHLCLRNSPSDSFDAMAFHVDLRPEGNEVYLPEVPWIFHIPGHYRDARQEKELGRMLLERFTLIADCMGSGGLVSAEDIYRFIL